MNNQMVIDSPVESGVSETTCTTQETQNFVSQDIPVATCQSYAGFGGACLSRRNE